MRITQKLEDLMMIGAWIIILTAAGAVIEALHWAFFEPKPILSQIAVFAAAAGLIKWLQWELYGRPEEDEKGYPLISEALTKTVVEGETQ